MTGGLLDDPGLIAGAAGDAGLQAAELDRWMQEPETSAAVERDIEAARSPSAAARALDHKLGGPPGQRRYTAPSYELRRSGGGASASVPGFHPVEAYEAAIASIDPELERRPKPERVEQLLEWATVPLATAEMMIAAGTATAIVMVMQQPEAVVRAALAKAAKPTPAGADFYWSMRTTSRGYDPTIWSVGSSTSPG